MTEVRPRHPISKAARNERRKAFATTCNAASVAMLISVGLQPLMAGRFSLPGFVFGGVVFVALQGVLHYVLRYVED